MLRFLWDCVLGLYVGWKLRRLRKLTSSEDGDFASRISYGNHVTYVDCTGMSPAEASRLIQWTRREMMEQGVIVGQKTGRA